MFGESAVLLSLTLVAVVSRMANFCCIFAWKLMRSVGETPKMVMYVCTSISGGPEIQPLRRDLQ
jgi:hypothetical protein